jgi:two-component system, oxyanion-binding sensor
VPAALLENAVANRLALTPGNAAVDVPDFLAFTRHEATFPWTSDAMWFYSQMVRWKQIEASPEHAQSARSSYRPDLYRDALCPLGVAASTMDARFSEFFDQRIFDPDDIVAYISAS